MKLKSLRFEFLTFVLLAAIAPAQETPPPVSPPAVPAEAAVQAPAANPKADLAAAVEKLATSYTWSQTTSFGGNWGDRTTSGKKGSGGYLMVTMPGRDQEFQVLSREGKAAMQRDGAWVVPDPEAEGEGRDRWTARMIQNLREPAIEAKELMAKITDAKMENGNIRGTLGEEAAKELMSLRGGRRGGGGGTPPEVTGAAGSVTFMITDGTLTGYDMTLTGRMNFNGEDRDVTRRTKIQFTGVGSTTFDIPESAAGLLAD